MNSTALVKRFSIGLASTSAIILGATLAAPAQAQTVISGYTTSGADMDGMSVLVQFLDGSSEQAIWGTTGDNAGGAFGSDWDLTFSGWTTFSSPWTFSSSNPLGISSLSINAIPGNTLFDDGNSAVSTPGSAGGRAFNVKSGDGPDDWAYSNALDISTGDTWGKLSMSWDDGFSGTMTFIADTDNGTIDNPVTAADVPEPGMLAALLGVAAIGFGANKQRKQSQAA